MAKRDPIETFVQHFEKLNENINDVSNDLNKLKEMNQELKDIVVKLNHLITGNGTPEKGLLIRVDRLERSEEARTWLIRTALGAAIVSVVGFIWNVIKNY